MAMRSWKPHRNACRPLTSVQFCPAGSAQFTGVPYRADRVLRVRQVGDGKGGTKVPIPTRASAANGTTVRLVLASNGLAERPAEEAGCALRAQNDKSARSAPQSPPGRSSDC